MTTLSTKQLHRWSTWLRQSLAYTVAALLVLGILGVTTRFTIGAYHWLEYYIFAIVLVSLVGGSRRISLWLDQIPERWFIIGLIILFAVSRFLWIWLVPTQPLSDAAVFHSFAGVLSRFRPVPADLLFFPAWGYALFLGMVYSVTGPNILIGQMLNIALGTISAWLLYRLATAIAGRRIGRVAVVLFTFWPNYLAFSGLLMSEHLALVFLLAFLLLLIRGIQATTTVWPKLIGAGVCMACMLAVRPALFVAAFCFVPVLSWEQGATMQRVGRLMVVVAFAVASYGAYYLGVEKVFHRAPIASSVPFLMGTNYEHLGRWNENDAARYNEIAYNVSFSAANAYATQTAIERARSEPVRFLKLMARKLVYFWEDDTYAAFASTEMLQSTSRFSLPSAQVPAAQSVLYRAYQQLLNTRALFSGLVDGVSAVMIAISQYYYLIVLVFGTIGAFALARQDFDAPMAMVLVYVLATSGLHMITEVNHRYRFGAQVLLLLVVAVGLVGQDRFHASVPRYVPRPTSDCS